MPPPTSPHIGFRLAHELEGLLLGIQADSRINDAERARLKRWLDVNEPFSGLRPFTELHEKARSALEDGVLTLEEVEDLVFVTQKLTTVNPYFDAMRTGIQVLMGHLSGIAADQQVNRAELDAIVVWAKDWSHLQGLWPFDEAVSVATGLITQDTPASKAYSELKALVDQFPLAGEYEGASVPPIIQRICAVDPELIFADRCFVFTGESARCTRADIEAEVTDRGGLSHPRVTKKVHYLVVCDEGNPHWAFSCYGRKVEQAYKLRRNGHPLTIVHEIDFWDAIA